jgi:hypothetical protein
MSDIRYRSCYIVDIIIKNDNIQLSDSVGRNYIVANSEIALESYKKWFNNVFLKGIAQTLTIFEYIIVDISECEMELHITKFLTEK